MEHENYAKSGVVIARGHLAALLDAFHRATGMPMTAISRDVAGIDPGFLRSYQTGNFTFGTYDQFVSRLSAVWPDDLPWPDSVPRQAPSEIDDAQRAAIAARMHKNLPAFASRGDGANMGADANG